MSEPVNWPTALPQIVDEQGYSWDWGDSTIRTSMEEGPDKVRKLQTSSPDAHTVTMLLSIEQVKSLNTYHKVTLQGGSIPFIFNHPVTQVSTVFRFLSTPKITPVGGVNFSASMTWEELYEAT